MYSWVPLSAPAMLLVEAGSTGSGRPDRGSPRAAGRGRRRSPRRRASSPTSRRTAARACRHSSIRCGAAASPSTRPSASASRRAGSIVTTTTRRPGAAASQPDHGRRRRLADAARATAHDHRRLGRASCRSTCGSTAVPTVAGSPRSADSGGRSALGVDAGRRRPVRRPSASMSLASEPGPLPVGQHDHRAAEGSSPVGARSASCISMRLRRKSAAARNQRRRVAGSSDADRAASSISSGVGNASSSSTEFMHRPDRAARRPGPRARRRSRSAR